METLKPQFTPGQSITNAPTSSIEEKLTNLQYQQELDNKNQQNKDLTEKVETLKIKLQESKDRLKDFDKLKLQVHLISKHSTIFLYYTCSNFFRTIN